MEENVAQAILTQITTLATQVNTMQESINVLQGTVSNLQGTVNNMQSQITDLSIGQMKLSEKIDRVEQNLRAEIKQEVDKVRIELKAEIQEVRTELKEDIAVLNEEMAQLKEIALFNKETGETIISTLDKEHKVNKSNIRVINIASMENKKYILDHEKRIRALENKQHYKNAVPLV